MIAIDPGTRLTYNCPSIKHPSLPSPITPSAFGGSSAFPSVGLLNHAHKGFTTVRSILACLGNTASTANAHVQERLGGVRELFGLLGAEPRLSGLR